MWLIGQQTDAIQQLAEWLLRNGSGPSIMLLCLVLVARWARPKVEKLIEGHVELLQRASTGFERTNELIPVLTGFIKETYRHLRFQLTTILIIDIDQVDRRRMEIELAPIARQFGLVIVSVPTIEDSFPLVMQAAVIILDVRLPDSTSPDVSRMFSRLAQPPVVVFTGIEDPQGLAGMDVINKNTDDPFGELGRRVSEILTDARR